MESAAGEMVESSVRQVGPLALQFVSPHAHVVARFDSLYAAFPVEDSALGTATHVTIRIAPAPDEEPVGWVCHIDGVRSGRGVDLAAIEELVTRRVNRLVLDREPDRLHLHGGAVTRDGVTLLIIGRSGSGKSTLVAALVARGWKYLSDEQLGILPGGVVVPYPRPITLRRDSWRLFEDLGLEARASSTTARVEVPVADLGEPHALDPLRVSLILRPDVTVEESGVGALTVAEAVEALVLDTLDLERAGDTGFEALIELALVASAWTITGTALDVTVGVIEDLVATAPLQQQTAAMTEAIPGSLTTGCAWQFDDASGVVYESGSGTLVRLDSDGIAAWSALAATATWPEGAEHSPFVEALADAGLIATIEV